MCSTQLHLRTLTGTQVVACVGQRSCWGSLGWLMATPASILLQLEAITWQSVCKMEAGIVVGYICETRAGVRERVGASASDS